MSKVRHVKCICYRSFNLTIDIMNYTRKCFRFCGKYLPQWLYSTGNAMTVILTTQGQGTHTGFSAEYSYAGCPTFTNLYLVCCQVHVCSLCFIKESYPSFYL